MSEPTDFNLNGLDLEIARRIDAVCRRYEADVREDDQPQASTTTWSTCLTTGVPPSGPS